MVSRFGFIKIIIIKRTEDLNYFSQCALNVFNTRVSQFDINYWNKWIFPRHSNLLRCTCNIVHIAQTGPQGHFSVGPQICRVSINIQCLCGKSGTKTSLCLQTWRNDAVSCSNFPRKPTRTTQIRKHYHKLTFMNQAKVRWWVWTLARYGLSQILISDHF